MAFLALAFADNAFKDWGIKKPEELFCLTVPDFKESLAIQWKPACYAGLGFGGRTEVPKIRYYTQHVVCVLYITTAHSISAIYSAKRVCCSILLMKCILVSVLYLFIVDSQQILLQQILPSFLPP